MTAPYLDLFLGAFIVYLVYSAWTRLDSRFPILAALALIVVAGALDVEGSTARAGTLEEYIVIFLGGGIVLLVVDHVREARQGANPPSESAARVSPDQASPDAPNERERSPDQPFDGLEKEPVTVVDAAGRDHDQDEQSGEGEAERGEKPSGDRRVEDEEQDRDG